MKNDPDEQKAAEDARHVDLPHRTGAETHDEGPDDTSDGDGAVGMQDREIPRQEGAGSPAPRPTAEGVDRRGELPDR